MEIYYMRNVDEQSHTYPRGGETGIYFRVLFLNIVHCPVLIVISLLLGGDIN